MLPIAHAILGHSFEGGVLMSQCICQVCHCPVDCGETLCPRCDTDLEVRSCVNGLCCGEATNNAVIKIIREVKPGLFVVQKEDGKYGIRRFPDDKIPEIGSTIQDSYEIRIKETLKHPRKKGG